MAGVAPRPVPVVVALRAGRVGVRRRRPAAPPLSAAGFVTLRFRGGTGSSRPGGCPGAGASAAGGPPRPAARSRVSGGVPQGGRISLREGPVVPADGGRLAGRPRASGGDRWARHFGPGRGVRPGWSRSAVRRGRGKAASPSMASTRSCPIRDASKTKEVFAVKGGLHATGRRRSVGPAVAEVNRARMKKRGRHRYMVMPFRRGRPIRTVRAAIPIPPGPRRPGDRPPVRGIAAPRPRRPAPPRRGSCLARLPAGAAEPGSRWASRATARGCAGR